MAAFGKFKCTTQEALDEETGERIPAAEISNLFFHHQQSLANEYVKLQRLACHLWSPRACGVALICPGKERI